MRKKFLPAAKIIKLAVLLYVAFPIAVKGQGFSPATTTRLQFVIDSFQNNPANPYIGGMSAAIKVDGLAFWQGATGHAARNVDAQNNLLPGGTPFTTNVLSRMYSVTKTFTATLVLELAKEHVFHLDDPVSNFLPLNLINPALNGGVTIRQLLAHESGYSEYTDELQLQIAVAFQPTHSWTAFEILSFVHQVNTPGTERKYSSTNYITLGAIIETVTHKTIQQYFRQRYFTPLHLRSMFLAVREPLWNGATLASPHDNLSGFNPIFQLTGQPTFPDAITNVSAFPFTAVASAAFTGGGIVTNVADMAEWGNALYGARATNKSIVKMMMQSISSTPDEDGDYLGYGIIRSTKISATDVFVGHDGNGPGYRSVMFYQPDRKMTIAILTNYRGAKLYDVAKALFESLPDFTCGKKRGGHHGDDEDDDDDKNKKEDKVLICFNGNTICVDRDAAANHIRRGAYLGSCERRHHHMDNKVEEMSGSKTTSAMERIKPDAESFPMNVSPNPFNDHITVTFKTTTSGKISLTLFDINGKPVVTTINGFAEKGVLQKIEFKTANLSPGTYITRLQAGNGVSQQKIVLIR